MRKPGSGRKASRMFFNPVGNESRWGGILRRVSKEKTMIKILEHPDIMMDAFLVNGGDYLSFGSFWGRDTAVQHFLARLSVSASEGGLSEFTLDNRRDRPIRIANSDALTKMTGRVNQTVFGDLVHVWLMEKQLTKPDLVNRKASLIYRQDEEAEQVQNKLWDLIKVVSHLPLLDAWQEPVISLLHSRAKILLDGGRGVGVSAYFIDLSDAELLEEELETMIKSGQLAI